MFIYNNSEKNSVHTHLYIYIDFDYYVKEIITDSRSLSLMHLPVGCAGWPSACEAARGLAISSGNFPLTIPKIVVNHGLTISHWQLEMD